MKLLRMLRKRKHKNTIRKILKNDLVHKWVQTIAIILAGIWAIYTFVYKEIKEQISMNEKPAHLTSSIHFENVGTKGNLQAIKIKFEIKNESQQKVHLLRSIYCIYAQLLNNKSKRLKFNTREKFIYYSTKCINEGIEGILSIGNLENEYILIADGILFNNWSLDQNERTSQSIILQLPKNKFDSIEVDAILLHAKDIRNIKANWSFNDKGFPVYQLNKITNKNEYIEIKSSNEDKQFLETKGFSIYTQKELFSLW